MSGIRMLDKPTLAITTGAGTVVGVGATKSAENAQSLLNSSFDQIMGGQFTWYGSDMITCAGVALSIAGIIVTMYRIQVTKRLKDAL
ncbi:hypothetical protein [Photobacterium toruni]|uniref:hypothetical protein n=1 Tax=Photobacterium toruni TaxID=1935446 RepID=UPI00211018EE|nr:hypothetical protein [Photobacterium toruni]